MKRALRAAGPAALATLTLLTLAAGATGASPYIDVRVSVKVILNPADGTRPPTAQGAPISDAQIQAWFQTANDSLLASFGRGYRFNVVGVIPIGTPCTTCLSTNPSFWYATTFPDNQPQQMLNLENTAKATPAFAWDPTAVNIYINQGKGNGAVSSFPFDLPPDDRSNEIVIGGATIQDNTYRRAFGGATFHHEVGHWFNLRHTHNNQPACTDNTSLLCSGCNGADDDSVTDTIEDRSCAAPCQGCPPGWQRDDIAQHNYGLLYGQLNATQRGKVDDIYENNMSYHNGGMTYGHYIEYQLTEGQLDYWADTANNVRHAVTTGRTRFVGPCPPPGCGAPISSTYSYGSVTSAHAAAQAGDVLLLRPGTYPEILTLNKPVTLRATRMGTARVGP